MTPKHPSAPQNTGEVIIYQTADGQTSIDVKMENDTVWLTQQQMSILFQKDQSVIARHIQNVFREGELDENSNMQILHNTISKYKPTRIYNLDVIISVGYRVKSQRGTQFRIWANRILKEYLVKGYAINNKLAALFRHRNQSPEKQIIQDEKDISCNAPRTDGTYVLVRRDGTCQLRLDFRNHETMKRELLAALEE